MKKPELLAPAGSFQKAKTAFLYGADAVYCGTPKLSLRSRVEIDNTDLLKTIELAHELNKKIYVTMNIYARDEDYDEIKEQAIMLNEARVDGIIVSDGGVLNAVRQYAPDVDIHISTQANAVSLNSSEFWYRNGAKRVILARELNKKEIRHIAEVKPNGLELEMFVHGAICFGYSGRCFLSNFLAGRSSNLGDCAQSCRWQYNVYVEENRKPGALMPVENDEHGTYIFSSKDLCLIRELPEIIDMGIESLKIEGRLKTEYYLATVINTYRHAIDDYIESPNTYSPEKYLRELDKTKTRGLTTLYFNDKNNQDIQDYSGNQYNTDYEFGGKVVGVDKEKVIIEIRNKLSVGDNMEILFPNRLDGYKFVIQKLYDIETDAEIDTINPGVEGQKVKMEIPVPVKEGYILRRKKN